MTDTTITNIIIMIFLALLTVGILIVLSKPTASFIYFFVSDSGEVVGDTVGSLITISAGMPGEADIIYRNPSADYRYRLDPDKKIVFIKAEIKQKAEEEISKKNIEESLNLIIQEIYSSTGVKIKNDFDIVSFSSITIHKNDEVGTTLETPNVIDNR